MQQNTKAILLMLLVVTICYIIKQAVPYFPAIGLCGATSYLIGKYLTDKD